MHPDHLADMAFFVQILESGSLTAAGRSLGLPKSTISRRLAALEQRLGAPLVHRSTRALTPTDFGQRYFRRVQPIVREARQAQAEAESEHATPTGLIRLSLPNAYGQMVLMPRLFAFMAAFPSVRLDIRLTDERASIISDGLDLAIRMGPLEDSELVARQIARIEMKMVASPGYLAKQGIPQHPMDLSNHLAVLTRADLDQWQLGQERIKLRWNISTGSMLITRDAVVQGLGIGVLPAFLADKAIQAKQLVALLPSYHFSDVAVSALWPRSQAPSLALTSLVNFLLSREPSR